MKSFILLTVMSLSLTAYSQTARKEYDPEQEERCYVELKALGCLTSKGEEDHKCAEVRKAKLSRACAAMHQEKKSN